jgi:glycosyltransferase involved in cell wall biosynthesis
VIASRLGSMKETIRDGYNGLHFTPGDVKDLKNKIELLIKLTSDNHGLYKNARQTYLEKYQPEVHYSSIMEIYQNTIKDYTNR